MKDGVFFVLLLLSFYSCSVKQNELSLIESDYTIDLDGKADTIALSAFFKSPKVIILENDSDCLIGRINEFQFFDGFFFILDKKFSKSLFVFDKDGRFIRKIGSVGNGPGEYINLVDFSLDTENRIIFLLDHGQRIHKYHIDGSFVKTITPKVQKSNILSIQYYSGKLYMCVEPYKSTLDDYMLLEAESDDGMILSRYLQRKYNKGWSKLFTTGHSSFISRLNVPPLYTRLFMDYIVTIGDSIVPYIELKSKNLSTDKDLINFPEITEYERFLKAIEDFSKIWDVHSYVENEDFILFRYRCGRKTAYNTLIYNKKTKTVRIANFFINDLIYTSDKRGFGGFVFSDSKGAYEILHDKQIANLRESIINNEVLTELDKMNELLQLNEESNPVILYYEYK